MRIPITIIYKSKEKIDITRLLSSITKRVNTSVAAKSSVSAGCLIETDGFGNKVWERLYGGGRPSDAEAVAAATYGGYIVAGWCKEDDVSDRDVYLLRIDSDGNLPDDVRPF